MAIQDSTVTIKGVDAAVKKVEIMKDKDGNFRVVVYGESKTSLGDPIGLKEVLASRPASNTTLSAMWAAALPILRTGNGLES